jgi:hypothetical protein
MIENRYNNSILSTGEAFTDYPEGEQRIFVERTLPYAFILTKGVGKMVRDVRVFANTDISRKGAKEAITALRDYAISHIETWTNQQLQAVAGTQTLFIVYNSESDMRLDFSKDLLTIEQIQEANEGAEVWLSYDISDIGLITLVNQLLNWL